MQKWEYHRVAETQYLHIPDMDRLGVQGWELVGVTAAGPNNQVYAYFKRPVVEEESERDYSVNGGSGYV
jgi:hypothetical protein